MKTMNLAKLSLIIGLAIELFAPRADAYFADSKTQLDAATTTLTRRFYQTLAGGIVTGNEAQTNSTIVWFVADTLANGIQTTDLSAGNVLGNDDIILWQDYGDGQQTGNANARYLRTGISVLDNVGFENAPIYVYVWNATYISSGPNSVFGPDNTSLPLQGLAGAFNEINVQDGMKYGTLLLGPRPPPMSGNASWAIFQNVFMDQFTVAAIPEPSTFALAGLGLVGLIGYRRFKK